MKKIKPSDLVMMNDSFYRVELAYARDDNLLFGERIYRKNAKLFLHNNLAKIVKRAAQICQNEHNSRFVLYDGLRTIEAQEKMLHTKRVQENRHWLEKPRLLSPAGFGGHPRAMAIDIGLETLNGELLDFGCPFDFLADNPHKEHNPAHREFAHPAKILNNRKILDNCVKKASNDLNLNIFLLPQEWWDFRIPNDIFNQYAPISENDLPNEMRLLDH